MKLRTLSAALLALAFTACPTPPPTPDANNVELDGGNPTPRDACSGGCAANQRCDTVRRTCVDACGGCDAGVCVAISPGVFQCRETAVTCNGALCEPGQVACLGGQCACLSSLSGALDTCQTAGQWCNGGTCANPKALQQCNVGDTTATCPSGHLCQPVFGARLAICSKNCQGDNDCGRGELCSEVGCLPLGLFGIECAQNIPEADGGWRVGDGGVGFALKTVTVGNTCLLKNNRDVPTEGPGLGTGNCTYSIFQFWSDGVYPFETCRPPGNAQEGQPCRDDFSPGAIATQCGTGLHCAKTRGGDDGVCMRMCNAQPELNGFISQPACGTGEACVNLLRYTDPNANAVLGVCMKSCDIFDGTKNTCANVGTNPASCVPTEASGDFAVSLDGSGVCIPQRATVANAGEACSETDAFRGAACGSAQLCTSLNADAPASCIEACDVDCNPADGGTGPARCSTQPNARCSGSKTCRRVTSTSGARVGFCL